MSQRNITEYTAQNSHHAETRISCAHAGQNKACQTFL